MSNEIQNVQIKLKELLTQKNEQELSLMKIKCEIREQKCKLEKIKADKACEDKKNNAEELKQSEPIKKKSKHRNH